MGTYKIGIFFGLNQSKTPPKMAFGHFCPLFPSQPFPSLDKEKEDKEKEDNSNNNNSNNNNNYLPSTPSAPSVHSIVDLGDDGFWYSKIATVVFRVIWERKKNCRLISHRNRNTLWILEVVYVVARTNSC
jgi:hypothetical protein